MSDLYNGLARYGDGIALVKANGLNSSGKDIGGHGWVADGIWSIGMTVKYWYYSDNPTDPDNKILECYSEGEISEYIHFNWGFGGNANGYFLIDVLNPNEGFLYDDPLKQSISDNIEYSKSFQYAIFNND